MSNVVYFIIAVLAVIFVMIAAMRYKSFKNWLVYAVSEAEKYLGSGTGKLKIRYAYDLAIKQYPVIAKIIPWSLFSKLVDAALVVMRQMIDDNQMIANVISGKKKEE
jgi:hypothetical protein|nr:MAG TPA_asm: holin [Caudoviricetes sp.]